MSTKPLLFWAVQSIQILCVALTMQATMQATTQTTRPSIQAQRSEPSSTQKPRFTENDAREVEVTIQGSQQILTGRIVTQTPAGQILLEEPSGSYHQLVASTVLKIKETGRPFVSYTAKQTGDHLKQLMGGGEITTTQHFVICSAASPRYTEFCGKLLERVAEQFPTVLKKTGIEFPPLPSSLPVMIFATSADLQAFAEKQHPEVDFSDTPGYYSVTHNQILFSADKDNLKARTNSDIARSLKQAPRIVETMVHETVHLLQYNSGLINRFAANPTWLSEGMAVYFEPASLRSSLLWNRAGNTNRLHLEGLKAADAHSKFSLPLPELLADNQAFEKPETVRFAYAESWAITWTLMKRHPEAYGRLLNAQRKLKPLMPLTGEEQVRRLEQSLKMTTDGLESEIRKAFRRQL